MKQINQISQKRFLMRALSFVCVLLMGLAMISCGNEEDGNWDPMKWKTEVNMNKNGDISASAEGGTYVFNCTNYNGIWVSQVEQVNYEGKRELYPLPGQDNDFNNVATPWGKVNAEKGVATIELYPNDSSEKREYLVSVTAGDIFFLFTFKQAGK